MIQEKLKYKIYIDTADRKERSIRLVEFLKNGKETEIDSVVGEIDIVVGLKNILSKHGLKASDIVLFSPNLGPGSFTGLKTGVTVTNVLNWVIGIKKLNELDYPNYGANPNIQIKKFD